MCCDDCFELRMVLPVCCLVLNSVWQHEYLLNWACDQSIPEFNSQSAGGDQVDFDCTPAPRVAGDSQLRGGEAFLIEPASGDFVQTAAEGANPIQRLDGLDDYPVAGTETRFSNLLKVIGRPRNARKRKANPALANFECPAT